MRIYATLATIWAAEAIKVMTEQTGSGGNVEKVTNEIVGGSGSGENVATPEPEKNENGMSDSAINEEEAKGSPVGQEEKSEDEEENVLSLDKKEGL